MEKTFKKQIALVDTGIVYAMSDKDDSWHERVKNFIKNSNDILTIPSTVAPEVCYLLNSYLGIEVERKFINSLILGELKVEHFKMEDLKRINELLKAYSDANIGFVDASIVAIAERLKVDRILTTDRRHFSIIKPSHCPIFTLLP
ncbi:MAG TPA: type II toxin-antitoxin system VapC family toxin [Candidatus Brocadiia bacterium]|nr:PIN domain-containing protein [Planctomycetota bacterium]MDO8092950.1 PIN domain-containing protein [Candidatus Brocadiales bacterium]